MQIAALPSRSDVRQKPPEPVTAWRSLTCANYPIRLAAPGGFGGEPVDKVLRCIDVAFTPFIFKGQMACRVCRAVNRPVALKVTAALGHFLQQQADLPIHLRFNTEY